MSTFPTRETERNRHEPYRCNLRCTGDGVCCLEASTNHYPRKTHRSQRCATVLNIFGMAQPGVARSVADGLALSGATPVEPRSVQRSAPPASHVARKMTADGYVGFKLPDNRKCEKPAGIFQRFAFPSQEAVQ
jgi:hypothetical protein